MKNDLDAFFDAIDHTADLSFNPDEVATPATGKQMIARRASGSSATGFIRPGERAVDGTPFEVVATKCPKYAGPPSGRAPDANEKRVIWPLQNEYLDVRLGRDVFKNSRNWDNVKWIDRIARTAAIPKNAVRAPSLLLS